MHALSPKTPTETTSNQCESAALHTTHTMRMHTNAHAYVYTFNMQKLCSSWVKGDRIERSESKMVGVGEVASEKRHRTE